MKACTSWHLDCLIYSPQWLCTDTKLYKTITSSLYYRSNIADLSSGSGTAALVIPNDPYRFKGNKLALKDWMPRIVVPTKKDLTK